MKGSNYRQKGLCSTATFEENAGEFERRPVLNLENRLLAPEMIDEPDLAPGVLEGELRALERINCWSMSARIVWPPIVRWAGRLSPRPVRVLDLATGAGDIPIALWKRARKSGVQIEIDGCDVKKDAVDYARRRARRAGAHGDFFQFDAAADPLPSGYDVIMCSLFLHHLNDAGACALLARMAASARNAICINDLLRCRRGLWLARIGSLVLTRSPETHRDAPHSVRAAFTAREIRDVAETAGLGGYRLNRRWPCRFLLEWERTQRCHAGRG